MSIVLHMANGQDLVYSGDAEVLVNPNPDPQLDEVLLAVDEVGSIEEVIGSGE